VEERQRQYFLPYAAGIPGEVLVIHIPYLTLVYGVATPNFPPTVLGLERGVKYRAFYWEPSLGIEIDPGHIAIPNSGRLLKRDDFGGGEATVD
jgi:hypothetical protein